jgi:hypothetical protein
MDPYKIPKWEKPSVIKTKMSSDDVQSDAIALMKEFDEYLKQQKLL